MSINVGTAIAFLEMDMSGFKNSLASAGTDLKNFATGGGIQNVTNAMNSVGSEMTTKVTLPIAGIGAAAANASMDFEAQMSKVQAISGATGDDLQALKDQAIQLGADTNFSASEAAEGMELFASSGFKVNDIMASMGGILDTAAAGGVSIAQATDVAANALNGFGMAASADNVTHIGDVLAKLAGDTNAEIMDTGEAMKYIAPVSKALGISFEDTAASIGLLSNAGIKGSQAGTTLRGALTNLAAPSKGANELMAELGMNFFDAQGKMLPMTDILQILKDKTAGLTQQQKASAMETLFGKEAMSGMLAMVDQGPEKFDELSKSLKNCDGASKEMAGVMSNNLKGSLNAMEGSLETAAIKIGDVLAPMIKNVATWIGDMANKFSALPKPMQEFIVKAAIVAAAIGPVLLILAKLIESVRTVVSVFTGLTKIVNIVSALPAMLTSPIGAIVLAIMAIAFVVYEVIKHWDSIKAYFSNLFTWLKTVFDGFWTWLKSFFSQWGPTILTIIAPFLGIPLLIWQHWDAIKGPLQAVWDFLVSGFKKVVDFFTSGFEGLKMFFSDLVGFFKNIGGYIIDGLLGGISEKWNSVKEKFSGMANMVKSVFASGIDSHSPSREFIKFGQYIGDGLVIGLDQQEDAITKKMGGIANKIKGVGNVSAELNSLNKVAVSGNYAGGQSSMRGVSDKAFNFTPNITMHIAVADTGAKGTAQLTSELKTMAQSAIKNSMVNEFMADALRL